MIKIKVNQSNRVRTIKIIARRELKSTFYGIGFYIVLTLALLISSFILKSYVQTIGTEGLIISSNPLNYPLYLSVLIGAIYLALSSTITISREREDGTLQTLFFGPVDNISYLLGKYLQQIICFIIILAVFILYFLISSLLINFVFSLSLLKMILMFILVGSGIIAFGMFISTLTKKVKTSIILFTTVIIIFLGLQFVNSFLMEMNPEEVSGVILYLRNGINLINNVISWISPFSYLSRAVKAVNIGTMAAYSQSISFSLIYTIVMLTLTIWSFRSKGVRK